ncbi:MAG: dihydropteroate synthase, partial [Kiritimatiellae bacterium]|nr:dihydropteroate synthase [Kiritimatiellia bacterium]
DSGIAEEALCMDPGFGFGLKGAENAEVLRALPEIAAAVSPCPLLVGPSRKHFVAALYPASGGDRDAATAAFCEDAAALGARIFRCHAVPPFASRPRTGASGTLRG